MSRKEKRRLIENLRLCGIHSAGRAFGHVGKRAVYVDFCIPNELVHISTPKHQKGFSLGRLEAIVEPSPYRVAPFCKHFKRCGGCEWQHISYQRQLELKREILVNALNKYAIVTPEVPLTIASPQQTYYRNKLEYAFSMRTDGDTELAVSIPTLGFHPFDSFQEVEQIDECFLQPDPSRRVAETAQQLGIEMNIPFYNQHDGSGILRSLTIRTTQSNELMLIAGFTPNYPELREPYLTELLKRIPEITSLYFTELSGFKSSYSTSELKLLAGGEYIHETVNGLRFRLNAKSFFQPNPIQAAAIYQRIVEHAGFNPTDLVYDLYTGVGSIACSVAGKVQKVIGIEGTPEAIEDAKHNAKANGIANADFLTGDILETFKPAFVAQHGKPDVVILDPPRSGTLIEIKRTIVESAPRKIVYLSCNPVSLAFDLTMLTNGYRVSYIQPFDMFPHTHHVETLVVLERE